MLCNIIGTPSVKLETINPIANLYLIFIFIIIKNHNYLNRQFSGIKLFLEFRLLNLNGKF